MNCLQIDLKMRTHKSLKKRVPIDDEHKNAIATTAPSFLICSMGIQARLL